MRKGQWDVLLWNSPGRTHSSWAQANMLVVEKKTCRGSCTTELYSQNGLYQVFSMQNGTWPKIFTEQKCFQECSQLKLKHLPAFSHGRPQTGHVSIHFFLPRRAKFELSHAISLQCHVKCGSAQRSRQMLMANRPEKYTAHAAKNPSLLYRETVTSAFWGLGERKRKMEQVTACWSRQLWSV